MSATWMTKYGPRRVRVEPPTLEDALYAAEGLTADPTQQIKIAAELMRVPVDETRAAAERIIKARASRPETIRGPRSSSPVIVERRSPRRIQRESAR